VKKVAYVSGPYRDNRGIHFVKQNIREAEAVALELWRMGYAVICPHMNTAFLDGACPDGVWLAGDLELLDRSDLIVMMPRHIESQGALAELVHAAIRGTPIFYWPVDEPLLVENAKVVKAR
jgi:hypothetical protein